MANGIIVMVSGFEFIKRKRASAYDLLLTSLGFFRIFLQALIFVSNLIFFFTLQIFIGQESFLFFFFINEVNLWLATYLSVFYCLKIANIVHPFFLWLKTRLSRLVPLWIMLSLLFSFAISVGHDLLYWPTAKQELKRFGAGNTTVNSIFLYLFPAPVLVLGLIVPFCMFSAASLLLLYSLCRHTRQMRGMATGFRDPSTKAHIWAIISIFSFLVLYITYYVGVMILLFGPSSQTLVLFFYFSLAALYPSAHSIILILGNSKLKHYIRKFLLSSKCCLRRGSSLDSTQTQ
ncbi:taste receptor type 2 member 1-like [Dromiciops gliroides]|uniref:taste receptor type 2 member 1-like n=1 Tax=Dromiciops gliroides TaxID=33562 RepID=UPI001CC74847|nr:taste receptor type 2 member 1-like [Dromiciops gliroides]